MPAAHQPRRFKPLINPKPGPANRLRQRVEFPRWFEPFQEDAPYKVVYGGRSGSKTRTVAMWLVLQAASRRCKVACIREFGVGIEQSVKASLVWAIVHLGLSPYFDVQARTIKCPATGSEFFFQGIERNPESVRGWDEITHVWVEEAHRLSHESAFILIPTFARGDVQVEAWFTFNPASRTDWVWQRFIRNPRPTDIIRKVDWRDNPWFPASSNEERLAFKKANPQRYAHQWEGRPDDASADVQVLSYDMLSDCMEAFRRGLHLQADVREIHAGLDIADGGDDRNALVIRQGPTILSVEAWFAQQAGNFRPTARRVHNRLVDMDVWRLYLDASGLGSPMRGVLEDVREETQQGNVLQYGVHGEWAGGSVKGERRQYSPRIANKDRFARRNIQMAFAVRHRARRTVRLLAGEDIDPNACLFIDPDMPHVEEYLEEMVRPIWRDNPTTGRTELDKRGKENEKSPDRFDATCFAFAADSEDGIRDE